jgi:phage baseplate assembly protein W
MPYKNIILTPAQYSEQHREQTSQFYKGFSTNTPDQNVKLYDFDVVKQDILNYFNTRQGERVMNPAFGCIIWDLLYEPFTADIKENINADVNRILTSDPRVNVQSINFTEYDYGIAAEINLTYVVTNQTDTLKLNFDRNLGLQVVQ